MNEKELFPFPTQIKGDRPTESRSRGIFPVLSAAGVWVLTTNSSGPHASKVLAEDRLSTSGGRYGQLSAPRR